MFDHYDIHGLPVTCDKAEAEKRDLRDEVHRLRNSESFDLVQAERRVEHAEQTARLATSNLVIAAKERDDARAGLAALRLLLGDAVRAVHVEHLPVPLGECRARLCVRLREAVTVR